MKDKGEATLDELEDLPKPQAGCDHVRFEALFREHADAVRAYALRRTDPEAAHEVVAETFAVAWRRFERLPDRALPWLLGVARKVLANQRRSVRRAEALSLRIVAQPFDEADRAVEEVDARLSALAAIDRLPPKEREALELLAWEGLSAGEAAQVLGCTKAAITLRVHRARRRLRDALRETAATPTATGVKEVP